MYDSVRNRVAGTLSIYNILLENDINIAWILREFGIQLNFFYHLEVSLLN